MIRCAYVHGARLTPTTLFRDPEHCGRIVQHCPQWVSLNAGTFRPMNRIMVVSGARADRSGLIKGGGEMPLDRRQRRVWDQRRRVDVHPVRPCAPTLQHRHPMPRKDDWRAIHDNSEEMVSESA